MRILVCKKCGNMVAELKKVIIHQDAIDKHHASPMMGEIAYLREKYDLHMRVERYISDEIGMPDHDKSFIRE